MEAGGSSRSSGPGNISPLKLKWTERSEGVHGEMFQWYQDLIRLRRTIGDLNDADPATVQVQCCPDDKWLLMKRGSIMVACNFGAEPWRVSAGSAGPVLLASGEFETACEQLTVPPESVVI